MLRKTVSGIVLMLLLTSMLSSAFIIQPVKAAISICARSTIAGAWTSYEIGCTTIYGIPSNTGTFTITFPVAEGEYDISRVVKDDVYVILRIPICSEVEYIPKDVTIDPDIGTVTITASTEIPHYVFVIVVIDNSHIRNPTIAGKYTIEVSTSSGDMHVISIMITPPVEKPDLTISKIKPVQVIWDCDINDDGWVDLVQGKATAVAVYIDGFDTLSDDKIIEVDLNFEGKIYTGRITAGGLKEEKRLIVYVHPPQYIGHQFVIAEVDPGNYIEESNEGNNIKRQIITVKDMRGLHIAYFPIERPESYGGPYYPYAETVERSGEFILGVYPIAEAEFVNQRRDEVIRGHVKIPGQLGILWDCREIAKRAKRLGTDIGIGIVPYGYFDYHGVDASGYHFPLVKGMVVEVGYWTTTAHEVGHTYGLPPGLAREEYREDYDGNPASGFWVAKKQPIENKICFMGRATGFESFDAWICNDCYSHLFKKFREKNDPEILVVDGIIYKNGTVEVGEWYRVEEGKDDLDEIVSGDYSIQILDENENVLQEVSFSAQFWANVYPLGVIELEFAPFTFAIPYPKNASVAKVLYKNEIKAEIELTTKLLDDAMDRLIQDYEILIETIERTDIQEEVKNGLLDKLTNATMKAEQGLTYIDQGRDIQGANMLNSASNIIEAFVNEVNAQKGKKISKEDADGFISWAQKMILNLQNQIVRIVK